MPWLAWKKAIVNLPIRLKENLKRISGNSLTPLGAQNKEIGAATQMLVTGDILRLRHRLPQGFFFKNWEGFDNRAEVLITAVAVVVHHSYLQENDYYQKTDGVLGTRLQKRP